MPQKRELTPGAWIEAHEQARKALDAAFTLEATCLGNYLNQDHDLRIEAKKAWAILHELRLRIEEIAEAEAGVTSANETFGKFLKKADPGLTS